jgi:uncharacterized cupredoxin-like copper-binding protein
MTDQPSPLDDRMQMPPEGDAPPSAPRWVKVSGVIVGVVIILAIALVVLGGHGPGQHGPGQHLSSGGGSEIGAPAAADQATRTVHVTSLDRMAFDPGTSAVTAGETVTFEVTNAGQTMHEFTLGDAATRQEHAGMMAQIPEGMAHDIANSLWLLPGETKRLTWRFDARGTLEYGCHEPGHYEAGMYGEIVIS